MSSSNKRLSPVLIGVLAGLVALLDYIGVIAFPVGIFGVSGFYIGAAFYVAFALWFKWNALIGIYLGLLLGAILSGTFTVYAFVLALGNVIAAGMVWMVFAVTQVDRSLKTISSLLIYFISAIIGFSVLSAAWVITGFVLVGIIPAEAAKVAAIGWIVGDAIVLTLIGAPLIRWAGPLVNRIGLVR